LFHLAPQESTAAPSEETTAVSPGKTSNFQYLDKKKKRIFNWDYLSLSFLLCFNFSANNVEVKGKTEEETIIKFKISVIKFAAFLLVSLFTMEPSTEFVFVFFDSCSYTGKYCGSSWRNNASSAR